MEIKVCVDKRTELMGVLLLISDYYKENSKLIAECHNKEYREKIFNWFNKYKDEKAVKILNEIFLKFNFNYDAPIALILQLDEDFKYKKLLPYPFEDRLKSSPLAIEFLNELPNFAKKTKFMDYYNSNKDFYDKIILDVKNFIHIDVLEKFFNEFYKMKISEKFVINIMPFCTRSNYGVSPEGETWCNLGAKSVDNKLSFVWNDVGDLFAHEFSHRIVNPLAEKYAKLPKQFFHDIEEKLLKISYSGDLCILDEHIIRGIEYIFIKYYYKGTQNNLSPEEYAKSVIESYKEIGFVYLDIVVKLLENYYLNRDKYKDFEQYFPCFMSEFKKQKNKLNLKQN